MTRIAYDRLALKVVIEGHAKYDEVGKDIVCAGISSLTYALAMYADKLDNDGKTYFAPTIHLDNGDAEISVVVKGNYEHEARKVFDAICEG
jgi:uncharacterized protein YsxB (DUF464 family)